MKEIKRCLENKFTGKNMIVLEFQTNSRMNLKQPTHLCKMGNHGGDDPDFITPLTPNMLLTGCANVQVPIKDYNLSDKP